MYKGSDEARKQHPELSMQAQLFLELANQEFKKLVVALQTGRKSRSDVPDREFVRTAQRDQSDSPHPSPPANFMHIVLGDMARKFTVRL